MSPNIRCQFSKGYKNVVFFFNIRSKMFALQTQQVCCGSIHIEDTFTWKREMHSSPCKVDNEANAAVDSQKQVD